MDTQDCDPSRVLFWRAKHWPRSHIHSGSFSRTRKSAPGLEAVDGETEHSVPQIPQVYKGFSPRAEIPGQFICVSGQFICVPPAASALGHVTCKTSSRRWRTAMLRHLYVCSGSRASALTSLDSNNTFVPPFLALPAYTWSGRSPKPPPPPCLHPLFSIPASPSKRQSYPGARFLKSPDGAPLFP